MELRDRIAHRIKLRDLRLLETVVRLRSMAKAAAELNISQPAVSKAMGELEHAVGAKLVDRSRQGIEPTPHGRALLRRGSIIFDELRQGVAELECLSDPTAGEVRIGGSSATIVGIISAVIDRLSRQHPRMSFHVVTPGPAMHYHALRERTLDIVIAGLYAPVTEPDIASEILYDDQLVVVAANSNPWARRRKVKLSELANEPWALIPDDTRAGAATLEAFRANGLEMPRRTVTASSVHLRNELLETGRFLSVMQRSLVQLPVKHPSLKVLPVELGATRRPTVLLTLKNRTLSPVAKLFVECARETAKPLVKLARAR